MELLQSLGKFVLSCFTLDDGWELLLHSEKDAETGLEEGQDTSVKSPQ